MLKKLLKYEWKSVSVMLLLIHGILLVYTLIGRIGLGIAVNTTGESWGNSVANLYGISAGFYILVYVLFMLATAIATFFYLAVRIQRSLFSDEGYLTHTLPVTPTLTIWSKFLIFWIWSVIDFAVLCFSIFVLLFSFQDTLPEFLNFVTEFLNVLAGYQGSEIHLTTILMILDFIVQSIYFTFLLIFSMCLGNLFSTHKVLGTILSFFGINIVLSVLQTLLYLGMFGTGLFVSSSSAASSASGVSMMVGTTSGSSLETAGLASMIISIVWGLLFSVFYFLGSRYILSRKLNLE